MEFLIVVIVTFLVLYTGYKNQCVRCKKWWRRKNHGRFISDKYTRIETKTGYDTDRIGHGQKNAVTEGKVQVTALYIEYLHSYSCKKCAHRWSITKTVRYES